MSGRGGRGRGGGGRGGRGGGRGGRAAPPGLPGWDHETNILINDQPQDTYPVSGHGPPYAGIPVLLLISRPENLQATRGPPAV